MSLYSIELNGKNVASHLPYKKACEQAIQLDNFYEHKMVVDLIQEPVLPETKEFELAHLQHEMESNQAKINKILSEVEKEELTNDMNEMWLDQLMEEFFWAKNSLDDKIDFMTDMLNYYKIIKERRDKCPEQK